MKRANRTMQAAVLGAVAWGGAAWAQVQAPRYQSPIAAPLPQVTQPTPAASTPNGTVVEYAIARVNDQIIDRGDYDRAEQQLAEEVQQTKMSRADAAQRQKDLLRDMIDQQLLLSRGKELAINADAEVIRRMDEIRKQNNMDSMDALEKAVRESGVSVEDFKANIKNSIVTQQVVRDEVGRRLQLTQKQEEAYYEAHKQEYAQPEQIKLSEILVPTPENATDAQILQAQAKANDVVAQLKAGAKFDDLAKKVSGGPTADKGGDLGLFKRGQLAKVLEDQTFTLKPGDSTAPIRTRQGFVVLKVTQHQDAGVPPMKDIDEDLQEAIYKEAIQPALRTYLTKLREDAYIDIAPGYVDSGASAKETKPVFAAYTAPVVKQKAAEQKQRMESHSTPAPVVPGSAPAAAGSTPAAGNATVAGSTNGAADAPGAAMASTSAGAAPATSKTVASNTSPAKPGKVKKPRKEKIRYGQAPRNSLPAAPGETVVAAGPSLGAGAPLVPGQSAAPAGTTDVAANEDPLAPPPAVRKKTRFSERPKTEDANKPSPKALEKASVIPSAMTADDKATQSAQDSALGLGGDTATKKKPAKVKGEPKERLQDKAPTPPPAPPAQTPIPPKSVRDNGEPVVAPAPDPSTLPAVVPNIPATPPAPATPATPANPQ